MSGEPASPTGPTTTGADLQLDLRVPSRSVAVQAAIRPGLVTAVVGPNGAGKSTLLGAIAGTVRSQGHARLGTTELLGLPLHRRGVTHLRQDPTLFPHLTVGANAAYGPRSRGMSRGEAGSLVAPLLEAVGLQGMEDRRAGELSGGQAQRLALARALATDPAVLLLDEPFAALDVTARSALRCLLQQLLAGRTTLLVTHDLVDVLALADDVLVLQYGRVAAHGARDRVLERPATAFLAELTGKVLLTGRIERGTLVTDGGLRLPVVGSSTEGGPVRAVLDPTQVRLLAPTAAESGGASAMDLDVTGIEHRGGVLLVRLGEIAATVEAGAAAALDLLAQGTTVRAVVPPEALRVYAGDDEHARQP